MIFPLFPFLVSIFCLMLVLWAPHHIRPLPLFSHHDAIHLCCIVLVIFPKLIILLVCWAYRKFTCISTLFWIFFHLSIRMLLEWATFQNPGHLCRFRWCPSWFAHLTSLKRNLSYRLRSIGFCILISLSTFLSKSAIVLWKVFP